MCEKGWWTRHWHRSLDVKTGAEHERVTANGGDRRGGGLSLPCRHQWCPVAKREGRWRGREKVGDRACPVVINDVRLPSGREGGGAREKVGGHAAPVPHNADLLGVGRHLVELGVGDRGDAVELKAPERRRVGLALGPHDPPRQPGLLRAQRQNLKRGKKKGGGGVDPGVSVL